MSDTVLVALISGAAIISGVITDHVKQIDNISD